MASMKLGIIIQARMSSQRLPGKVLKNLGPQPLIQYLFDRVEKSGWPWLLATSDQPEDQALVDYCQSKNLLCIRGPLNNVSARFLTAAHTQGWEAFARISGDSPFLDPTLISAVISLFLKTSPDLATNVFPRSFPKGQSVEVLSTQALHKALPEMVSPDELEHVTPYFYRHSQRYKIENLLSPQPSPEIQLSVDTPEDWSRIESLLAVMSEPHWVYGWQDLLQLLARLP